MSFDLLQYRYHQLLQLIKGLVERNYASFSNGRVNNAEINLALLLMSK